MELDGVRLDEELYKYLLGFFSDSDIDSMLRAVKSPPSRYYIRVNTMKTTAEDLAAALRGRGIDASRDEGLGEALWIPVKGPNRVSPARRVVVANKQAAESVYLGANLYGPGVLYADPLLPGSEVSVAAPNGEVVAVGVARMDRRDMLRRSPGVAVEVVKSVYSMPKLRELREFQDGLFYEQSLPAQWVAHVLEPRVGEVIVDMNAAPGGKMGHVIQLTNGKARVIGIERHAKKVIQTKKTLDRLGLPGEVVQGDARYLVVDLPGLAGSVDGVLIDPPCSDLGVRPKLFDEKTMKQVKALAQYQRQFIAAAHELLRSGGTLVYSTCTITPIENEDNVDYAVRLGFSLEEVAVPGKLPGIGNAGGLVARFYPHVNDSPGFFIAKLRKK